MITLKEYILKSDKSEVYEIYKRLCDKPVDFNKITRLNMYEYILNYFRETPEKILEMCSSEEVNILKNLLSNNIEKRKDGYLEYVLFENLKSNYLILDNGLEYYIPSDFLNCIKMAINLLDNNHAYQDINDSVMIGLIRIYNVLEYKVFLDLVKKYVRTFDIMDLKEYIKGNVRLNKMLKLVVYRKKEYIVSLENDDYKDILVIRNDAIAHQNYILEEVVSIGKYKINLFNESILYFLNFLEIHTSAMYINSIIDGIIVYSGFDINDDKTLKTIASDIEELYLELKKVVNYFPCWIYNGNDIHNLEKTLAKPNKNDACPCGSGKKYKQCCGK